MASVKNGFQPSLMTLEGREQPGTMFSTGLDGAILAGAFGEEILKASRPALVTTQAPQQIDSTEISLLPAASRPLSVQSNGTIKVAEAKSIQAIDGLSDQRVFATIGDYVRANPDVAQRPGDFTGERGADLLNYRGDFDGVNGLANEFNTVVSDARTFDNYRVRGNPTKDCVFTHNLMNFTGVGTANVQIRGPGFATSGVDGGLPLVFNGTAMPATQLPTGLSGFGFTDYEIKVCGLGLDSTDMPAGHYYLSVQPIGFGSGRSFNSTTNGADAGGSGVGTTYGDKKGGPGAVGDSWFDSPYFGTGGWADSSIYLGVETDFSGGLCQTVAGGCDGES
jgi:hypothetical protein